MKVWKYISGNERNEILLLDETIDGSEFSRSLDGRKHLEDWVPVKAVRGMGKGGFSNAVWFYSGDPVLDDEALNVLYDLIKDNVEVLPIDFEHEKNFHLINITKVIDCFDRNKSEYLQFSDGRVYGITKISFIKSKIENEHIFKIKDLKLGSFFVSDEFKKRVEEYGLTGFYFELVWDSEVE